MSISRKIVIGFSALTALAGSLYWVLVFTGLFPVEELVPGYQNWFMSFPIADGWMFVCAGLAAVYAIRNHSRAVLFAPLTGANMIFLGLYGFLYGYNTGLLFILTPDELIEIAIKVYCLSVGSLLIYHGWKLNALSMPTAIDRSHA
ncbi:MAG TPA: hypothetical protein VFQ13_10610 [Anaerolineales bacterium]|nr:hypothetical protein [Anaerolineales bacterium]